MVEEDTGRRIDALEDRLRNLNLSRGASSTRISNDMASGVKLRMN